MCIKSFQYKMPSTITLPSIGEIDKKNSQAAFCTKSIKSTAKGEQILGCFFAPLIIGSLNLLLWNLEPNNNSGSFLTVLSTKRKYHNIWNSVKMMLVIMMTMMMKYLENLEKKGWGEIFEKLSTLCRFLQRCFTYGCNRFCLRATIFSIIHLAAPCFRLLS